MVEGRRFISHSKPHQKHADFVEVANADFVRGFFRTAVKTRISCLNALDTPRRHKSVIQKTQGYAENARASGHLGHKSGQTIDALS